MRGLILPVDPGEVRQIAPGNPRQLRNQLSELAAAP
jgi:hypothetical protein